MLTFRILGAGCSATQARRLAPRLLGLSVAVSHVLMACAGGDGGMDQGPLLPAAGTGAAPAAGTVDSAGGIGTAGTAMLGQAGGGQPGAGQGAPAGMGSAEAGAGGSMAVEPVAGVGAGMGAAGVAAAGTVAMAGVGGEAGTAGDQPMDGPDDPGACTASTDTGTMASGSGPYEVVIETNSDPWINEGTIYRPADLDAAERFPIYVWGNGGCARQGLSNRTANAEIASHGYFVIADGTPGGGDGNRSLGGADAGRPMIAYIDWAIAENNKPCSAYYHTLDITKVATNGFSCGGLMAQGTASDPRLTTWMINSSGGFSANAALYDATHGPTLIVQGGPSDIAYENGKRDFDNLSQRSYPTMLFSKDIGHGGDLFRSGGGDFNRLNLAWLNWWLKGDEGPGGKGFLVGDGCTLCNDSSWETDSANIP